MDLQNLIKNADPERIQQYLDWAKMHPRDPDRVDIIESIIESGLSPYRAAKRRHVSGLSHRSFKTLYYHARMVTQDLYEFLGLTVESTMRRLVIHGEAHCSRDQLSTVREACDQMGYEILEDIRIRIVPRSEGI